MFWIAVAGFGCVMFGVGAVVHRWSRGRTKRLGFTLLSVLTLAAWVAGSQTTWPFWQFWVIDRAELLTVVAPLIVTPVLIGYLCAAGCGWVVQRWIGEKAVNGD
jgi:hypothetical protein